MVRANLGDALRLRGGYSAVCWVVGVAAYLGSLLFFWQNPELFRTEHRIFTFYLWMGIPMLIAVGVINLFVRPIYVIASCKLYSDFLVEQKRTTDVHELPGRGASALVVFLVTLLIAATTYLYREEIGLMGILRVE